MSLFRTIAVGPASVDCGNGRCGLLLMRKAPAYATLGSKKGGSEVSSVSHGPAVYPRERSQWAEFLRIPEMWASLGISMMWLAVLFDAVYGSNFVSTNGSGTNSTTIPSAIFVALFAFLATASLAKYAFRNDKK
jgi:hypothetical protein